MGSDAIARIDAGEARLARVARANSGETAVLTTDALTPSSLLTWYQYSLRRLFFAVTVCCLVMSYLGWWYRTNVDLRDTADQIRASVLSLANKRPRTMTRGQWGCAVAWTNNLVCNSLLFEGKLDDLRRFKRELAEKTKGAVDMETILWIWDQHSRLTPAGRKYQRFREVMLDEIAKVGPNEDPWCMNVP